MAVLPILQDVFFLSVINNSVSPKPQIPNTIWIDTNYDVSNWVIQDTEPGLIVTQGLIWIVPTYQAANSTLNLGLNTQHDIILSIGSIRRYNVNTWEYLNGYIWDGNDWVNAGFYLYDTPYFNSSYPWTSYGSFSTEQTVEAFKITNSSGSNNCYSTSNRIDLTTFNEVVFDLEISNTSASNNWYVSVSANTGNFANAYTNAAAASPNWNSGAITRRKVVLNVSTLTGNYYINIGARRSSGSYYMNLYSIELR